MHPSMKGNVERGRATLRFWPVLSLFGVFVGFPTPPPGQGGGVEISVERVERLSREEARFQVKVRNGSGAAIFLTAINYAKLGLKDESRPRLYPLYLEQLRGKDGWKLVAPCMDAPPPDVIKLGPAESMTEDRGLKVPLGGVCKERDVQLEGKFRFRLAYFESEKQAKDYIDKLFSPQWPEARAANAFSEEFEIPPVIKRR